jgi:hypothetical protein
LTDVHPAVKLRMSETGQFSDIGEENVFIAQSIVGASTELAMAAGQAWLETINHRGDEARTAHQTS